jgi:hypothetical protein
MYINADISILRCLDHRLELKRRAKGGRSLGSCSEVRWTSEHEPRDATSAYSLEAIKVEERNW